MRFGGGIDFVQQRHLQRAVETHHAREEPSAAFVRQQRELARRVAKLGRVGGDAEIAGTGERQSAGHRRAVDHRDHRLVHAMQRRR